MEKMTFEPGSRRKKGLTCGESGDEGHDELMCVRSLE